MIGKRQRQLSAEMIGWISAVGPDLAATVSCLEPFPKGVVAQGINPRNAERNRYLGWTMSHPRRGVYVLGVTYEDQHDGRLDEDYFVSDVILETWRRYSPKRFVRAHPDYSGSHHGAKPQLLKIDPLE